MQHARAMSRLRDVWPWLPAHSAERPLFGGARPMPPSSKMSGFDKGGYLTLSSIGGSDSTPKGKDESVQPIKEGMAFWKKWMTMEDKPTYGREEPLCRNSMLPWHAQWHCLWDTAWWGPHGFLFGNGDETKKDAVDFKQCHCYFKWFFERDPFIPTPKDKETRQKLQREEPPDMKRMIIGKNMFIHLFFGILLGWLYAIIKVQLHGGDAPWITYFQDKAKASASTMMHSATSMAASALLAPGAEQLEPAKGAAPPSQPAALPGSRAEALMNTPR
jgi:hypothetical protein